MYFWCDEYTQNMSIQSIHVILYWGYFLVHDQKSVRDIPLKYYVSNIHGFNYCTMHDKNTYCFIDLFQSLCYTSIDFVDYIILEAEHCIDETTVAINKDLIEMTQLFLSLKNTTSK